MGDISIILPSVLTPVLTTLLLGIIMPWIISMRQRAEKKAIADKCICHPRAAVRAMWVLSAVAILLTVAALVCTILSIVNPEMMDTSADDIGGIIAVWVLCIALDVVTIVFSILFMRKIIYNSNSFTDIKLYNKKHEYFYKDITKIESTVKAESTYTDYGVINGRKGKLKIYFGEKCVKIPAWMFGITEFITLLQTQCPNLYINLI